MELNKYQTQLTDELLQSLPQEVREQLMDYINNVPFIQSLIKANREYAKDRPRDDKGRIIVDLANPHILENMDYFREAGMNYDKHGTYTNLRPNANPNSEYGQWARRERDRCWNGMVRESDGEWVTGLMYFYMNYCPIELTKIRKGTKIGDRVLTFPEVWEGIYWRFHYMDQARNGGLYNEFNGGSNGAELAARGKSKSYSMASILTHNFIFGENGTSYKNTVSTITAYQKEYLTKDGTLNKFMSMIDFNAKNTQFPNKRITNSLQTMTWQAGYVNDMGVKNGSLNAIYGVTSKDNVSKLRGKRAAFIGIEECGCHIRGTEVLMYDGSIKRVEDIVVGDKLMGPDNKPRTVNKVYSGVDDMYKITLANGEFQIVNKHHPVYFKKYNYSEHSFKNMTMTAPELYNTHIDNRFLISKSKVSFNHTDVFDPYFIGLWLGDGDSTRLSIANEDSEVLDYLCNNYNGELKDCSSSKTCKVFHISKRKNKGLYNEFDKLELFNHKHVPSVYKINDSNVQLKLIAGLIDTDGTYDAKHDRYEITQKWTRKTILDDVMFMCECNGLKCSMSERISSGKKSGILHYRLRISGDVSIIPTLIKRKISNNAIKYRQKNSWLDYTFKVSYYGLENYYGFTVDGDNLFLLADCTIVHNTFPKLEDMYNTMIPSVKDGDYWFGEIYVQGTAGDKDSDFEGAKKLMYNPKGYSLYAIPDVYDKVKQGKRNFVFFFPSYVNRKGCYNKDGVSDVTKAMIEILLDRYKIKYNSPDQSAITRTIAENPFTPAEAISRSRGNMFPTADLNERLAQIDANPKEYDNVYSGTLDVTKDGKIEFKPTDDIPIREFPHNDNKIAGAIEIFEMPAIDKQTKKPFQNRYILGCDPYDDDESETMSLGSIFVLDLWSDMIVAEYTGRPQFANDFFEIARRMTLFYNGMLNYENNKKGLFGYFQMNNCLHLLTDTLDFLKDKQLIKDMSYGNKAKGTNATLPINQFGRSLLRGWLLKPVTITSKVEDQQIEQTIPNLFKIRNRALIQELINYNVDGNFDRISSMGMLMLLREDRLVLWGGEPNKEQTVEKDYLGNDDYFTKNFDARFKQKQAPIDDHKIIES